MNRADLADEIRGAGFGLRYADGPVVRYSFRKEKTKAGHAPKRKLKTPDWDIIEMAATCSTCDAVASKKDIEFAEDAADSYQSFARLIWPCIDHMEGCPALPYIPVSKKAARKLKNVKAKLETKAAKAPKSKKKASKKKAAKKSRRKKAD